MHEGWFTICVRVSPNAGKTAIKGVHDGAIKIGLAAPPVDGAANSALIAYLAKKLKVKKKSITIVSGQSSKNKKVRIDENVDKVFMAEQLGLSGEE
jgi:uncharacterized protein (TIGR00251 family)